jgi:hypothetical protein
MHQALLTQALNAFSGKDPSKNWPKCPRGTTVTASSRVLKQSRKALQDNMRRENIVQHAIERGYTPCFVFKTNRVFDDAPIGTASIVIGFLDDRQRLRMTAHCLLLPDNTLGASGLLDPTMLLLDDGTAIKWNQLP